MTTAAATTLKVSVDPDQLQDLYMGEPIADKVDALPMPERFNLIVAQVAIKKKVGSLILADQTIQDQQWTHGLVVVVKVGPSVFKGKRFEDMGLSPDDAPQVGDILWVSSKTPNRFTVDRYTFFEVPDDAILARWTREQRQHLHRIGFSL
jgi:hypothetical protein